MDVRQIAEQHPELLASILAASSGPLGEILVSQALTNLGFKVSVLSNNWRQRDLKVESLDGEEFFVETKTVRQKGSVWIVNQPPDPTRSKFWILVSAPRAAESLPREEDVKFFVLTTEEARDAWLLSSPAKNSKASITGDIRWNNLPDDCESAFHKLIAGSDND